MVQSGGVLVQSTRHTQPAYVLNLISHIGATAIFLTMAACSRNSNDQARFELVLPPHPSINAKSLNLQPQASDLPFCYLVNIVGDGLSSQPNKCYPVAGIRSRFQPPLSHLTLDVPKGSHRSVELYGYIPRTNENCGDSGLDLQTVPVNRLFRLAVKNDIDMNADEVSVKLEVVHPGLANHFAVQTEQPTECYTNLPPISGSDVVVVNDSMTGQYFTLKGRVSLDSQSQIQNGSHFQIRYEVQNVHR